MRQHQLLLPLGQGRHQEQLWMGAGGLGCLPYPVWFVPASPEKPALAGQHWAQAPLSPPLPRGDALLALKQEGGGNLMACEVL